MLIKLLQLNINADNYWDQLTSFLKTHSYDILHFQEVAGNNTNCYVHIKSKRDCFKALQNLLGEQYSSELSIAQRYTSDPDSYMGNATFYRKDFTLLEKKEVVLHKGPTYLPSEYKTGETSGRTLLHLKLKIKGKEVSFLNIHFAWGPNNIEKPYQTEQGNILLHYLRKVNSPFILSGDLNLTPEQPLIQKLNKLAINQITKNAITNTLDSKNHRAQILFPKGLAVDYIFTSSDLVVKNIALIEENLSDHLGLAAEIEL